MYYRSITLYHRLTWSQLPWVEPRHETLGHNTCAGDLGRGPALSNCKYRSITFVLPDDDLSARSSRSAPCTTEALLLYYRMTT